MRIVTFQRQKGFPRAGILMPSGKVLDLARAFSSKVPARAKSPADTQSLVLQLRGLSSSVLEIIRGGDLALTACFELAKDCQQGEFEEYLSPLESVQLLSPLLAPPAILHFESNFLQIQALYRFMNEEGSSVPAGWFKYPYFTYGSPHLVRGPLDSIHIPENEQMMDFELELAAILGEPVQDASVEDADDAILGYTLANDWTARSAQRSMAGSSKAKSIGTTLGPWLITKDELREAHGLKSRIFINGKPEAEGDTSSMQFSFGEMISFASEGTLLPAGTVILSGTLSNGSGLLIGRFLSPGDEVTFEVERFGTLQCRIHERTRNPVFRPSVADDQTM